MVSPHLTRTARPATHAFGIRALACTALCSLAVCVSSLASAQASLPPAHHAVSPTGAPSAVLPSPATAGPNYVFLNATSEQVEQAEKLEGGGGDHEGFKLHGHWIIDVRNPDGTSAQHRDFENALDFSGPSYLIGLLAGYYTPGDYMVVMGSSSGPAPCVGPTYPFCGIVQSLTTNPALAYCGVYQCTTGLSVTYNFGTNNGGPYSMVLAGSITAVQNGSIGTVYTIYNGCANTSTGTNPTIFPTTPATTSPAACQASTSPNTYAGPLSDATITAVPVIANQIIQVTVTITFS